MSLVPVPSPVTTDDSNTVRQPALSWVATSARTELEPTSTTVRVIKRIVSDEETSREVAKSPRIANEIGYICASGFFRNLRVHVMTINEEQTVPATPEVAQNEATKSAVAAEGATTSTTATAESPAEAPTPEAAPVAVSEPAPAAPAAVATPAPTPAPEAVSEPAPVAPATVATQIPAPAAVAPAVRTPAPVAPVSDADKPAVEVADDLDLFDQWMSSPDQAKTESSDNRRRLNRGDRIEATVIQVTKDRVFVDLGTKSEGVVPLNELTDENVDSAEGLVQVGDKINVVVIRTDGGDGNPIVSKKKADFDEAWLKIVEAHVEGTMITAPVVERVKGGLVVDIGVRGFVPATHVGSGKLRNLDKYVGQPLELKVIEIDKERKKVVLSNRDAEDKRRDELKDQIFTDVNPGDVLEGSVRRLTDYGAFVDLGGIDGLLHISEMSWMRINHPKEVLKEGQKINVMVLKLDKDTGKISLGLRQVLPDPWNQIKDNYTIGQKMTVIISRMVQSGAFVKLAEGAEAFLPISEISHRRIGKPQDVLTEGQEVELTVIDLRPDERRMVLSLKHGSTAEPQIGYGYGAPAPAEYDDRKGAPKDRMKKPAGGKKSGGGKGRDGDFDSGRSGGGGATIGERLGMLKGFHFRSEGDDAPATETSEAVETPAAPAAPEAPEAEKSAE